MWQGRGWVEGGPMWVSQWGCEGVWQGRGWVEGAGVGGGSQWGGEVW